MEVIDTINEKILVAKTEAFFALQDGAAAEKVYTDFMARIATEKVADELVLNIFYQLLVENKGPVAMIQFLLEKYPANKQAIGLFEISLYLIVGKGQDEIERLLDAYQESYGQAKDVLLLELEFRVSHGFYNQPRIREIIKLLKEQEAAA